MDDQKSIKQIIWGMALHTSMSIFGPMILLGAVGFFLDRHYQSKPKFLLIFIGIAFIVSNLILLRRRNQLKQFFANERSMKNGKPKDKQASSEKD